MNRHQRRANSKLNRISNTPGAESAVGNLPPELAQLLQVGISHYQAGRLVEAEACYRQVLNSQPDHAGTLFHLGVALHNQGKLDEAIATYRHAIQISPNFALPYANLGIALKKQEKLDEAIAAFRQAIQIKPNFNEAHFNLGVVLSDRRMLDEATVAYRQAIRLKPDHAEAHCNLGIALHDLGKLDEAIVAYRKAIILKPNLAVAHNGLGAAFMERGQLSEARASLEQAVRLSPNNARYRRGVSIITRFVDGDSRLAEMEQLIKDGAARPVNDRIEMHFALGKAYDDVGRHAEAFRQWLDGNALKRQQIAYDEATTLDELDRVRSVFTAEFIQASQNKNIGHQSSVPVFIIGMPRSGTTLVEQILASHPQVFGGGELPYFRRAVENTLTTPIASTATNKNIHLGASYLAEIERLAPGATHITDKMPRNFIFAGLIHLCLPKAPIIHIIRDPVDTCLSCFSILFAEEQDYTYDLAELGRYYKRYQNLMAHWHRVLPPGRILDVRYEDVVADLECQARRIISHCGLDWNPSCLDFYKTVRPVRTASATQVRQPIYNRAIGHWRAYADFLQPLLAEL